PGARPGIRGPWSAPAERHRPAGRCAPCKGCGADAIHPSRLTMVTAALLLAWGSHALALPTGAQPVAGNVSVAWPDARTLNVTQRSDKAIVNWTTFNVGASEAVNFAQPAVTSVILNRVIGGSYSEILGRISANGQVFLV